MTETYEVFHPSIGFDAVRPAHKIFQFPGGESHINMEPKSHLQVAYLHGGNGEDIMSLAMWADACHRHGLETIACIPYLPGARMDRGVPLGAKVYADMINAMKIDTIVAVDPHSDVAPALYDNLVVLSAADVMRSPGQMDGIIAPDVGAIKRAEQVAAKLFGLPVVQGYKHRDFATGKLSGFGVDQLEPQSHYLLVDDICDGGGTFNGLADHIAGKYSDAVKLSLWVTHGIFSQGPDELQKRFEWIGTTDSHSNMLVNNTGRIEIRPLLNTMLRATGKVKI